MNRSPLRFYNVLVASCIFVGLNLSASDFETITENNKIQGNPALSLTESRANWETACERWKKEIRELNKGHQILMTECGTPEEIQLKHSTRAFQSTGTLKLRVKTKDTPSEQPSTDDEE